MKKSQGLSQSSKNTPVPLGAVFEELAEIFAPLEAEGVDVDDFPDSLKAVFPDGKTYLAVVHGELEQIWLSSPLSGGLHFAYDPDEACWKDTRNQWELKTLLKKEFLILQANP